MSKSKRKSKIEIDETEYLFYQLSVENPMEKKFKRFLIHCCKSKIDIHDYVIDFFNQYVEYIEADTSKIKEKDLGDLTAIFTFSVMDAGFDIDGKTLRISVAKEKNTLVKNIYKKYSRKINIVKSR